VAGRDAILHGLPPNDAGGAGGHVVVSGLPPVDLELVATAPDGALARLAIGAREDAGTPVRFLLPRALDVIVRDEAGAAEAGVPVVLRKDRVFMTEERTTGADGRARFEGLSRDVIEAWAPEAGPDGRGLALGTADLGPGDGLVLAVLPVARDLLVRVRIDGKPGLPGRFELRAEGLVPGPLVEDPGAGELRGRVRQARPGTSLPIRLERTGFLAEGSRAEPRDAAGTLVGEIGLRSPGALLVRVLTPSGGGGFSLQLEQPDGTGGWRPAVGPGLPNGPVSGTGALVRMSPLDTGTYRVLDCLSACPSDPVWVQAGASPAEVTLDLRRVGWIGGRVVVPEGATVAGARVIVEGRIPGWTGVPALPEGQPVQPDGTFRVRVARFPVSLRASHPLFRSRGAVSVGEPRKDIELRLDAGPTLRFRTAPPLPDDAAPKVRVLVFRGGLDGPPSSEHTTRFQDGALRCGGFAPGRATLWIDAPDRAPAVVRGVELGEDDTDLGEVALPAGTALQVRLLAGAGGSPPQEAAICLIARTGPVYSRCGRSWKGEPEVTVRALQPGPFLLRASLAVDGQPRLVDREIIVEAGPDPTIVLDPR
jgi:hypothetical protein